MFNVHDNRKTIKEIFTMFDQKNLIVDDSYQRRSVWGEKDKIRLIETILMNMIIPELFFWRSETNPETGSSIIHIVDGQQRIKAIYSFVNNEFKLKTQYLLDEKIKMQYENKYFKDLDPETKKNFWNYQLMILEIDENAKRDEIITMFNRLNLTDYNLNDQEKRNSMSGEFAALAREISENSIWEEYRFFNNSDIRRMRDVEFCATLILLYKNGIIDQTGQAPINKAYEEYQTEYKDAEKDKEAVLSAISMLEEFLITEDIKKFLRRKTQLYSLFSIIFYMKREKLSVEDKFKQNLSEFVKLYSVFDNGIDLTAQLDPDEKILYEKLNKYKLASSEGSNKHTNRMIRFNVLKSFVFELTLTLEAARTTLYTKMAIEQV